MEEKAFPIKTLMIYMFNCLTNILINFDHGIIPACTKEMKIDLLIDDFELGILGSSVYAGLLTGSVVGTQLFSSYSTKRIVSASVLCCGMSLYLFLATKSIYVLMLSRFLVGFCQVFLVIFFPVWIDFFGGPFKTLWLTFMQLGVALGAVGGYFVTSLFLSHGGNWGQPYQLQIFLLTPCAIFYLFCDEDNLDVSGKQIITSDGTEMQSQMSFSVKIKYLMRNKLFFYTMMSLTSLFFVVNGVQFWISDYFRNVLLVPQHIVFKAYMAVSLSAPILGVAIGGTLLHLSGGYEGENALSICAFEALMASMCATPIPFLDNFTVALMMLWLMLFFGGSIVPGVTGIMISSIPADSRSTGNSIGHVFQELLGYLPSPMLYGLVITMTGGSTSRWGMVLLVMWSYWGLLFIILAMRCPKVDENNLLQVELQESEFILKTSNIPLLNDDNQFYDNNPRTRTLSYANKINKLQQGPQFFNDLRKKTSMSVADSIQIGNTFSRQGSIEHAPNFRSTRRRNSVLEGLNAVVSMVGRASVGINYMVKDEKDWDNIQTSQQQ